MNFTSKASITLTAALSAAEVLEAVRTVPGADQAILDAAQASAEAAKAPNGLTVVARSLTSSDDGSATVDLVYEKVEVVSKADAGQDVQKGTTAAPPLPPLPLGLELPGAAPAAV